MYLLGLLDLVLAHGFLESFLEKLLFAFGELGFAQFLMKFLFATVLLGGLFRKYGIEVDLIGIVIFNHTPVILRVKVLRARVTGVGSGLTYNNLLLLF